MPARTLLPSEAIDRIVGGTHWDPLSVLGPHPATVDGRTGLTIRAWLPYAKQVDLLPVPSCDPIRMTRIHPDGLFETTLGQPDGLDDYRLRVTDYDGTVSERTDPYAFPPLLSDFELHLFAEGTFYKAYDTLGAHTRTVRNTTGVHFVVWAPNAARVSVVGDFNRWDGRCHPMTSRGATGLWELFIPELTEGTLYKYEIRTRQSDAVLLKADPYACASELRPRTASIVYDVTRYRWQDRAWMAARAQRDPLSNPLAIYEVHLGSWMRKVEEGNRWLTYRE